ncbi:MAG: hypothetical protein PF961_07435 [Planctomycetota bacterium]|jgi:ADP-heptose:LPS heptosyltransferase|nr:hypothetical protein [Planctomycetota bacterium]
MTPKEAASTIIAWHRDPQSTALLHKGVLSPHLAAAADVLAEVGNRDDDAGRNAISALFGDVIETLNDSFSRQARDLSAAVFARIVWHCAQHSATLSDALGACGITGEAALHAYHHRVRNCTTPLPAQLQRIVILSRVTIGADVLLTTVVLQRLRAAYPDAELIVIGDPKLGGLLGGMPGVRIEALRYQRRGGLAERLGAWLPLRERITELAPDAVIAPDSRLDQLGLLPVIAPERYRLWENLFINGPASLASLLDHWCQATIPGSATQPVPPRLFLDTTAAAHSQRIAAASGTGLLAVKLDHGGNPAKALPRAGELHLLRSLRSSGWRILIDYGFGDEECANSNALMAELGWTPTEIDDSNHGGIALQELAPGQLATAEVIRFHGSIAGWAAALAGCNAALSYDSVGHHLAAALGVRLVTAFTGYQADDFPIAWQPCGPGHVDLITIPSDERDQPRHWDRVLAALGSPG